MKQSNTTFIFDLNGTIINDMGFHAVAWSYIINEVLNGGLSYEQVKQEMYGKNEELLIRIFGAEKFTPAEMHALSLQKEEYYQANYKHQMKCIEGFEDFATRAKARSIPMAIGSASITSNINFILYGLHLEAFFKAIVSADDVEISKPHPETFLKAAALLGVNPADCIVFEDAPKGVEAAQNAGMKCVVITSTHERQEFAQYENVLFFVEDYTNPLLHQLL